MDYNRKSISDKFGLDLGEVTVFRKWTTGGEFRKKILVKNVSAQTRTVSYSLPATKVFILPFPAPITLRPGMSTSLEVVFRPIKEENCFDEIKFNTSVLLHGRPASAATFHVPLRAVIPVLDVSGPTSLDLGLTACSEPVSFQHSLNNIGDINARIDFDVKEPFQISPSSLLISAGETASFSVEFFTKEVGAFTATAKWTAVPASTLAPSITGAEAHHQQHVLTLTGTTRLPHLHVQPLAPLHQSGMKAKNSKEDAFDAKTDSTFELEFSDVFIGTSASQHFTVTNVSEVASRVKIGFSKQRLPQSSKQQAPPPLLSGGKNSSLADSFFSISKKTAVLQPRESTTVEVRFSPKVPGFTPISKLAVKTASSKVAVISLKGVPSVPHLHTDTTLIAFGDLEVNTSVKKTFLLHNPCPVEVVFSFLLDNSMNVFSFSDMTSSSSSSSSPPNPPPTRSIVGKIRAHGQVRLQVCFAPPHPLPYAQRVYCLVDGAQAFFLDLLGTAHTPEIHPAVISPKHLRTLRVLGSYNLHSQTPTAIEQAMQNDPTLADALTSPPPLPESAEISLILRALFHSRGAHPGLAPGDLDPWLHLGTSMVSFSTPHLLFGAGSVTGPYESMSFTATNHSHCKSVLQWNVPTASAFTISPTSVEVAPGQTVAFKVSFRPGTPSTQFASDLSCLVYSKALRNFRLVTEKSFLCPTTLFLSCQGHSFGSNYSVALPRVHFTPALTSSQPLVFPPTPVGVAVYRTFSLHNVGDIAVLLNTPPLPAQGALSTPVSPFTVLPLAQSVGPGETTLLMVRFLPSGPGLFDARLPLSLNVGSRTVEIPCHGVGEVPFCPFADGHALSIPPIPVLSRFSMPVALTNYTHVPLRYALSLNDIHSTILRFPKPTGLLPPLATSVAPLDVSVPTPGRLSLPVTIAFAHPTPPPGTAYLPLAPPATGTVKVLLEGVPVSLSCEPHSLAFNAMSSVEAKTIQCTLFNPTGALLHFNLLNPLTSLSPEIATSVKFTFSPSSGVLAPHTSLTVDVHLALKHPPHPRKPYALPLKCELHTEADKAVGRKGVVMTLAEISFSVIAPALRVNFAHSPGLARDVLVHAFQLHKLNKMLLGELTASAVEGDMGVGVVGSARTVSLQFTNPGPLPAALALALPEDEMVHVSSWAKGGVALEPPGKRAHAEKVRTIAEKKLFTVSPNHLHLLPGQSGIIVITYRHTMPGVFSHPLKLALTNGPALAIKLFGRTVPAESRCCGPLAFFHSLLPTPVGALEPVSQQLFLPNNTPWPVRYGFDWPASAVLIPLANEAIANPGQCASVSVCVAPETAGTLTFTVKFTATPLTPSTLANGEDPSAKEDEDGQGSVTVSKGILRLKLTSFFPDGMGMGPGPHPPEGEEGVENSPAVSHLTVAAFNTIVATDSTLSRFIWNSTAPNSPLSPSSTPTACVGQAIALSSELLSFGSLPTFSRGARLSFVRNLCADPITLSVAGEREELPFGCGLVVSFERPGSSASSTPLSLSGNTGALKPSLSVVLPPYESVPLFVTLVSGSVPCVLNAHFALHLRVGGAGGFLPDAVVSVKAAVFTAEEYASIFGTPALRQYLEMRPSSIVSPLHLPPPKPPTDAGGEGEREEGMQRRLQALLFPDDDPERAAQRHNLFRHPQFGALASEVLHTVLREMLSSTTVRYVLQENEQAPLPYYNALRPRNTTASSPVPAESQQSADRFHQKCRLLASAPFKALASSVLAEALDSLLLEVAEGKVDLEEPTKLVANVRYSMKKTK